MHEAMRKRILRRLETLPETQLYQVLDYIEFLESRYNRGIPEETTALQKLAEKLEDGLRKGKVNPSNLREAFQLISTADRVLSSVSAAGKQLLDELQSTDEGGVSTRDTTRMSGTSGTRAVGTPAGRTVRAPDASGPRSTSVAAPHSPASPPAHRPDHPPAGISPPDRDEG